MGRRRRKQQSLRAILAASWRAEGYAEGYAEGAAAERRRLVDREAAADALAIRMTQANRRLWARIGDLEHQVFVRNHDGYRPLPF